MTQGLQPFLGEQVSSWAATVCVMSENELVLEGAHDVVAGMTWFAVSMGSICGSCLVVCQK